jgi:hypothetical protein
MSSSGGDALRQEVDALIARLGGRDAVLAYLSAERDLISKDSEQAGARRAGSPPSGPRGFDFSIRLQPDELRRLDEECIATGYTRNKWVNELLTRALTRRAQISNRDRVSVIEIAKRLRKMESLISHSTKALDALQASAQAIISQREQAMGFAVQVEALAEDLDQALKGNDAYWRGRLGEPGASGFAEVDTTAPTGPIT